MKNIKVIIMLLMVASIVLLTGCDIDTSPPMCKITSPNDGAVFHVGDQIPISWEIGGSVVQGWVLVDYAIFRETTTSGSATYQLTNVPGTGGRTIPIAVTIQYTDASKESDLIHVDIVE